MTYVDIFLTHPGEEDGGSAGGAELYSNGSYSFLILDACLRTYLESRFFLSKPVFLERAFASLNLYILILEPACIDLDAMAAIAHVRGPK
jgi:hypothetical protein